MQCILLLSSYVECYKWIKHPERRFSFDDQSVNVTQYLWLNQDQGNLIKLARKNGHSEEIALTWKMSNNTNEFSALMSWRISLIWLMIGGTVSWMFSLNDKYEYKSSWTYQEWWLCKDPRPNMALFLGIWNDMLSMMPSSYLISHWRTEQKQKMVLKASYIFVAMSNRGAKQIISSRRWVRRWYLIFCTILLGSISTATSRTLDAAISMSHCGPQGVGIYDEKQRSD